MYQVKCRHFNGYKPCSKNENCNEFCPSRDIPEPRILIVHLGALGAVLRSTSLLLAIKRKYPKSHITWVTQSPAQNLISPNSLIDRVYTTSSLDIKKLEVLEFDLGFCIDKSLDAVAILKTAKIKNVRGFTVEPFSGSIIPANPSANELWNLGLNNNLKFFINKKTEQRLIAEALELPYKRDPYQIELTPVERATAYRRKRAWSKSGKKIVGINTGCSSVIPYKKMSEFLHRKLIQLIIRHFDIEIVLLGGREDELRNHRISSGLNIHLSPTEYGLRDGLCSIEACDIVVSGDSLGMHMAIGLKKWTVAWFGPTCSHEIDLYGRGEKILTTVSCGPCWKRNCSNNPMCNDNVPLESIIEALGRGLNQNQSDKVSRHSEISF